MTGGFPLLVFHFAASAKSLGYGWKQRLQPFLDQLTHGRIQGTHGPLHDNLVGDYIGSGSPGDFPDSNDAGIQGGNVSGYNGLECRQDVSCHADWINGLVRMGPMAPFSVYRYFQGITGSHGWPFPHADGRLREFPARYAVR